jgi:hypothetical protein
MFYKQSFKEIYICGLGSCLNSAVKIALNIIDICSNVSIDKVETESIILQDDYKDSQTYVRIIN